MIKVIFFCLLCFLFSSCGSFAYHPNYVVSEKKVEEEKVNIE